MKKPTWLGVGWETFLKRNDFRMRYCDNKNCFALYRLDDMEIELLGDRRSQRVKLSGVSIGDGYEYGMSFPGVKTMRDLEVLLKFMENPDERTS
jgi:hypothetical protein